MRLSQLWEDDVDAAGGRTGLYDQLHKQKDHDRERQRKEREQTKEKADQQYDEAEAERQRQRDERAARLEKRLDSVPKYKTVAKPSPCFPCPVCAARNGWQRRWRKLSRPVPRT